MGSIEILVRNEDERPPADRMRHGFPEATRAAVSTEAVKIALPTERLRGQFQEMVRQLASIIEEAQSAETSFPLDEVKLSLEVTAEGSVSLLGFSGAKVAGQGGIELTFKRKQ